MWLHKFGYGEGRVKKFKNFLIIYYYYLILKKYFDKENINNTFVGHPLVEKQNFQKTDISNLAHARKNYFSFLEVDYLN